MSPSFNPYVAWLGIARGPFPPNHYALLGLPSGVVDSAQIHRAATVRIALVNSYREEQPEWASRLLQEIYAAQQCLLDPQARAAYDWQLAAAQPAAPPSLAPPQAAAAPQFELSDPAPDEAVSPRAAAPRTLRRRRTRSVWSTLIGYVGGAVIGLGLGYYILLQMGPQYDFLNLGASPPAAAKIETAPAASEKKSEAAPSPQRPDSSPVEPEVKVVVVADEPRKTSPPEPPAPSRQTAVAQALARLPKHFELPPVIETERFEWGSLELSGEESLRLELVGAPLPNLPDRRFEVRPEAGNRWSVVLASTDAGQENDGAPVGYFAWEGAALTFRWTPLAAEAPWRQLRNCALNLAVDKQEHLMQLRTPQLTGPLRVDLTEKTMLTPLTVEDLPDLSSVRLHLKEIREFPAQARIEPADRRLRVGEAVTATFSEAPGVEISWKFAMRKDLPHLEFTARYDLRSGRDFEFTTDRVNKQKASFEKILAEGSVEGPRRQQYAERLAYNYRSVASISIPSGPGSALAEMQKNQQLDKIQGEIESNARKLQRLIQRLPEVQSDLKTLNYVAELGNQIHQRTEVDFQLVSLITYGDVEMEHVLLKSDRSAANPEAPQELAQPSRQSTSPGDRVAPPDDATAAGVLRQAGAAYKAEYAAADTADARRRLARRILADAQRIPAASPEKFVLLRLARDVAARGEDVDLALQATSLIAAAFEIDALRWRSETLLNVSKYVKDDASREHCAAALLECAEALRSMGRHENVAELAAAARTLVDSGRDAAPRGQARTLIERIQTLQETSAASAAARRTLETNPEDPEAHLTLGKEACFTYGQWELGLKHLARSGDEALRTIAERDAALPTSPQEQVAVGDLWWNWSQTAPDALRAPARSRAQFWYRQAAPHLTGLTQTKALKRLQEK